MAPARGVGVSLILAIALVISGTTAQQVRTHNGSLVLEAGGALLTLTPPSGGCGSASSSSSTPYSPIVSQADLQAVLASQIQPQVSCNVGDIRNISIPLCMPQ
jgi:hypothetical protein